MGSVLLETGRIASIYFGARDQNPMIRTCPTGPLATRRGCFCTLHRLDSLAGVPSNVSCRLLPALGHFLLEIFGSFDPKFKRRSFTFGALPCPSTLGLTILGSRTDIAVPCCLLFGALVAVFAG